MKSDASENIAFEFTTFGLKSWNLEPGSRVEALPSVVEQTAK